MIRSITNGVGIHISGSAHNNPYIDTTRASSGTVRYVHNNLEVYDGSVWWPLQSNYPMIELDGVTQEAIQWVRAKMEQEKRMIELAKTHPAVADALLARDRAEDALTIVTALCETK